MSRYTTQVRYICEYYAGLDKSEGQMSVNDILDKSVDKVFDFPWDVFDEKYRDVLEKKILKHFYTREIGFETVGLFKQKLDAKMNEIMPLYNQYYKSTLLEFNPFYNVDYTTSDKRTSTGDKNNTSNSLTGFESTEEKQSQKNNNTTKDITTTFNDSETMTYDSQDVNEHDTSKKIQYGKVEDSKTDKKQETKYSDTKETKNKYSDTPQGSLSNVENGTYLTNATINDETASGSGSVTDSGTAKNSSSGSDVETMTGTDKSIKNGEDVKSHTGTNEVNEVFGGVDTYTEKTKTNSSTNADSTNAEVFTNTDDYLSHVIGKNSGDSYSKMLNEFRSTFLNIDMLVIEELECLFMQIW